MDNDFDDSPWTHEEIEALAWAATEPDDWGEAENPLGGRPPHAGSGT